MQATRIVDAIGDWLDADSEPRRYGAEDDFYAVQSPAYRAANRPWRVSASCVRSPVSRRTCLHSFGPWSRRGPGGRR